MSSGGRISIKITIKQQKLLAAILCVASPLSYAASGTFDEIVVTSTRARSRLMQR